MKRGTGLAAGLGLVSLLVSTWVYLRMEHKQVHEVTPQQAKQLQGLNALQLEALQGALDFYAKEKNALPERLGDLVQAGYLDAVPLEAFSRLSSTVSVFDGQGGWVYGTDGTVSVNHAQQPIGP